MPQGTHPRYHVPPARDFVNVSLSPAQRRLLDLVLRRGRPSTIDVRRLASVSNVSELALQLSERLMAAGIPWQIVCELRPHTNQFGTRVMLGHWVLEPAVLDAEVA